MTVIVWVVLSTLAAATDRLSELTLTTASGGDTMKLIVVATSLGAPYMLVWDNVRDLSHFEVMLRASDVMPSERVPLKVVVPSFVKVMVTFFAT